MATNPRPAPVARALHRYDRMIGHPVRFHVEPSRMDRVQVAVRLVLLTALAAIGCSSVYWVLYLALPVAAALLVSRDGPERYLRDDAPGIVRFLRWLAGAYAYLWLLTDALPTSDARGPVELEVEAGGRPTAGSALWRLVLSLPALLLLAILSMVASVLWILGAVAIVAVARTPAWIADFIAMKLRYQLRLTAYHLSVVDAYPSIADVSLPHAPPSGVA
jgi:hypothetical protein